MKPGDMLGPYRVLDALGAGGMGEVYRARDTRLDRTVAIKVLPGHLNADPERRRRFEQEARAASSLNHPNIVTIHDIGSTDAVHFIAMEYVEGETLDRLIGRKGMPAKQAVGYAVQMADALAKAHGAGIVHRDIKPSNIMVTPDGLVKILDFGVAKLIDRERAPDEMPTRTTAPITEDGRVVGTVAYMSPEQATGGHLDARSDIFSYGAVLYEMLTGRRPFIGETEASTLEAILAREPAAPSSTVSGLPLELERVILRCLRKDPQRRWQTMADLKVALQELKEELDSGKITEVSVAAVAAARPRRRWILAGAGALALLLAAAATGWWYLQREPSPAGLEPELLTFEGGAGMSPSISPDGSLLAYAADRDGRFSIFVRQRGAREAIRRTEHECNDWYPVFSPDGLKIVYRSERDGGGLYMIDALGEGGAELKVADGGQLPSFSPDGKMIAYTVPDAWDTRARLFVVAAGGGVPRRFQPDFIVAGSVVVFQAPVWSPDGAHLLFWGVRPGRGETSRWWIAPAEGGDAVPLGGMPPPPAWQLRLVLAWRGQYLYYAEGEPIGGSTYYRIRMTPRPWTAVGTPEKLAMSAGAPSSGSISAQGRMVFDSLNRLTNIWSAPLDWRGIAAGPLEEVTADRTGKRHLSVATTGARLAYVAYGPPGQRNVEIRVRDLATGRESLIAGSGNYPYLDPVLSHDGSRIAYMDRPEKTRLSYVAATAEGSGRVVCEDCMIENFLPDPAAILVRRADRLLRLRLSDGQEVPIAELAGALDLSFSPTGDFVAFTRWRDDGVALLHVAPVTDPPASSSSWKLVTEDRRFIGPPEWSPDGRVLYYLSQRDGFKCIWAQPIAPDGSPAGAPVAALHMHPGAGRLDQGFMNFGVTNDRVFVLQSKLRGDVWSIQLDRRRQ